MRDLKSDNNVLMMEYELKKQLYLSLIPVPVEATQIPVTLLSHPLSIHGEYPPRALRLCIRFREIIVQDDMEVWKYPVLYLRRTRLPPVQRCEK